MAMASVFTTKGGGDEDSSCSWSDDDDDEADEKELKIVKPMTEDEIFKMQQSAINGEWMLNTPMVKWSHEQLEAWATTLSATELEKKAMKSDFNPQKILKCRDPEQLMKLLEISKEEAIELLEELKVQQQIEKQQKYESKLRFFGSSSSSKKSSKNIDAARWKSRIITKWTVEQTIEWVKSLRIKKQNEKDLIQKMIDCEVDGETIVDLLSGDATQLSKVLDVKPSVATIIYHAAEQVLQNAMNDEKLSKKLSNIDDEKKNDASPLRDQYRNRIINLEKYPYIVLSKNEDVIMKYNNNDGIPRAKMPGCDHGIAAETMYFYIKSVFEKHSMATKIYCPHPKCQKEWDWSYCVAVADMSDSELKFWNKERNERLASVNYRKCPNCGITCNKPDKLGTLRVRCQCGGSDWCWICRKRWRSGTNTARLCGNKDCNMVRNINDQLRNAKLFEPMGLTGKKIKIPELRACPVCMAIVHHVEQDDNIGHHCKHVKCPQCPDLNFCFVCLGVYDKMKGWPCGDYDFACPPKPIQQFE